MYRKNDDSDWSTGYWSRGSINQATAFKADYIASFAGSGTESDLYQLAAANHLQKLAATVKSGSDVCNNSDIWYKLTANIDLSPTCGEGIDSWTPIGCGDHIFCPFKANLDGDGKTISNLYINTENYYQGLFYKLSGATVKNLTLTGLVTAGAI